MEIKISAKQTIKVLYILAWLIFIGLIIDASGFVSNTILSLAYKPEMAKDFWTHLDLSSLYNFDKGHFFAQTVHMSIVAILKALMFYTVIKILDKKNLDVNQPFNIKIRGYILMLVYITLGIGIFSIWGTSYSEWLGSQGINMPSNENLKLDGGGVWLFMSITLLVIAQFFKRGIEIQQENELTV